MSGEIGDISGALGDSVLGAGLAKTVEPGAGGPALDESGHTAENACLNCEAPLTGAYCHNCGQRAHVHRSLQGFLHDLMHGVLHFDGKFWRTMPLLTWRPGKVMREYVDGKRAKYLSPVALFLFTVFVTFALFNASGGFGDIKPNVAGVTQDQLQASLRDADKAVANINQKLTAEGLPADDAAKLREDAKEASAARDLLAELVAANASNGTSGSPFRPTVTLDPSELAIDRPASAQAAHDPAADKSGNWLTHAWQKAQANPSLLLYKLQTNAYKLSWLLIPLSLPFMWLLFPFSRRFKMYDHTVVVTYSISFMTMLAVIMSFGVAYQIWPLIAGPALFAPFHLYRSLRGAYSLSRFGAIWRMAALSFAIWITLALFVLIMVGMVIA